jgi:hypothetical protein
MAAGRPRNIETPDDLWKMWEEYKSYIDNNPDYEQVVSVKGDIVERKLKKPYLKQGFSAFCFRNYGISIQRYLNGEYEEFVYVVTCIREEWQEDQLSGALTGRYKAPTLIGNLNNVVAKKEVTGDVKIETIIPTDLRKKTND